MWTQKERQVTAGLLASRFGWICWYCNTSVHGVEFHLDHIVPQSIGGTDDISNLALTCKFCNRAKFTHTVAEFFEWLQHVRYGSTWTPILETRKEHEEKYMQTLRHDISAIPPMAGVLQSTLQMGGVEFGSSSTTLYCQWCGSEILAKVSKRKKYCGSKCGRLASVNGKLERETGRDRQIG